MCCSGSSGRDGRSWGCGVVVTVVAPVVQVVGSRRVAVLP